MLFIIFTYKKNINKCLHQLYEFMFTIIKEIELLYIIYFMTYNLRFVIYFKVR